MAGSPRRLSRHAGRSGFSQAAGGALWVELGLSSPDSPNPLPPCSPPAAPYVHLSTFGREVEDRGQRVRQGPTPVRTRARPGREKRGTFLRTPRPGTVARLKATRARPARPPPPRLGRGQRTALGSVDQRVSIERTEEEGSGSGRPAPPRCYLYLIYSLFLNVSLAIVRRSRAGGPRPRCAGIWFCWCSGEDNGAKECGEGRRRRGAQMSGRSAASLDQRYCPEARLAADDSSQGMISRHLAQLPSLRLCAVPRL